MSAVCSASAAGGGRSMNSPDFVVFLKKWYNGFVNAVCESNVKFD
jgi:hypothetical protein